MADLLRSGLRNALKSADMLKTSRSLELIGVSSAAEVWAHLQRQPSYESWMTLENIGRLKSGKDVDPLVWQIDHIIPIKFPGSGENSTITPEDMAIRFHYTNLQPLRASVNVSKGNRRVGV